MNSIPRCELKFIGRKNKVMKIVFNNDVVGKCWLANNSVFAFLYDYGRMSEGDTYETVYDLISNYYKQKGA